MKKKSMIVISAVFLTGFLVGSYTSPNVGSAASNVVLASVEWVTNQINPLQSRVTKLESEVQTLRNAINDGGIEDSLPSHVYVNSTKATVHKGATRDYAIVATFTKGKKLPVIAEHNGTDGKWYRVEYSTGKYGWIYSGDISTKSVAALSTVTITNTTDVRRGATTDYQSITVLQKGTTVKYVSSFTNNKNEQWYNIELSNGVRGWILAIHGEVK
ncbi:SH3 domain-containing protein [Metabacillus halosaccharovorans]|uniref:SH3 domain-containing protein n=1 Tax=Metabacillus halosaccharovorans TaxID=930124 RepID=UPI000995A780|nr:SH3 domain-containing protein [Metabacillus halosaccharovorans]